MITPNRENHMYTTIPPETVISLEPQNPQEEYVETMIAEHNFEESYEYMNLKYEQEIEIAQLEELIKNEPTI